jgi:hypothetical protein
MSALSRRTVLRGAAALPAVAIELPIAAAASPADAHLIALGSGWKGSSSNTWMRSQNGRPLARRSR